jgi:hypothetical protein
MGIKGLVVCAVLCVLPLATVAALAQSSNHAGAKPQTAVHAAASKPVPQSTAAPTPDAASQPETPTFPTPHITVATPPPPASAPWSLHEKISWAANLVLALLGYAGIWLAWTLLKTIQRHTEYAEAAADAAAASAQAALLNAQAVIHAERPWILVSVEPSRSAENCFSILATNRGRTPARILATEEQAVIAADEQHLPAAPEYDEQPKSPLTPVLLLPGEFTAIKTFCRDDVRGLCDSDERFRQIETWEEKIFFHGKLTYLNLIAPANSPAHETSWCCWYIHGRQNSGLVIAGPPAYNMHT